MLQHYFIENRLFGSSSRRHIELDRGVWGIPLSKLFYCAECGEVFAKCPLLITPTQVASWTSVFACCRTCQPKSGLHIPGSIWHHDAAFVSALPPKVLQRELLLHLDFFQKDPP